MPDGARILTDAEWEVFAIGLDSLRDGIEADIAFGTDATEAGVEVFDRLTPEQKLALLADVASALRDPGASAPAHTAANEGAIMAVLAAFRDMLHAEIDLGEPDDTDLRRFLLAAVGEPEGGEGRFPLPTSGDWGAWEDALEILSDRVFWDDDFEMEDEFLDLPPEEARASLQLAGIDPDYFLAIPDDPDERGLIRARQALARLLGQPIPDDEGLFPALIDRYHDLTIGPVSREDLAAWEGSPWLEEAGLGDPEWDCDVPRWREVLAGAIPEEPFRVRPADGDLDRELPAGIRFEPTGSVWVVRDEGIGFWCDVLGNGWAIAPDDDMPALAFPSAAEAAAAYAQALRMYRDRSIRREAALARLAISS